MPAPLRRRQALKAPAVSGPPATITSKEECAECGSVVTTFSDGRVEVTDVSLEILVSMGMAYEKGVCGTCGRAKHTSV